MKFLIIANIDTDALRHNFDYRITNYGGKCAATSRNMSKHVERDTNATPPNFYIIRKNIINLEHNIERKKEKNIQTLHKDSVKRNKTSKSSKRHQIAGMLRHIFFEAISTIDRKFVEMKIKTIKIKTVKQK